MSPDPTQVVGFTHPGRVARFQRRRAAMLAELVTSAALVVCIIVAVVALSVGVAHAQARDAVVDAGLPAAALFSAVLVGMGGITALIAGGGDEPRE